MPEQQRGLALDARLIDHLFPFHFVVDRKLEVVQFGRALSKVCTNVCTGSRLDALVTLFRPRVAALEFDRLAAESNRACFIDSVTTQVRLRGELLHLAEEGWLLFVGAPWFTDVDMLHRSGLDLADFTVHDPIVDFLYMVQAKTVAAEDARRFSETIIRQRDELEEKNRA